MPDQAVIDGSLKTGPALSATSDLPLLAAMDTPADTAGSPSAPAPVIPPGETAAEAPPSPEAPAPEGPGAPSGDQTAPQEEPSATSRDRLGPRLSEMARQRNEALAAERRANERTDKILEAMTALQDQFRVMMEGQNRPLTPESAPPPELPRPRRTEFADPDAYEDALADWAESRAVTRAERRAQEIAQQAEERRNAAEQKARTEAQQQEAQRQQNEVLSRWQSSVAAYTRDHPEFDINELANRAADEFPVTQPVIGTLLMIDNGPAVLDYFREHPDELKRIAALPEGRVPVEIGKIEGRLTAPAPSPVAVPRAPAPPTNRVGSSAAAAQESMYDIGSQPGRTEEYAAMRQKTLDAERKAHMFGTRLP